MWKSKAGASFFGALILVALCLAAKPLLPQSNPAYQFGYITRNENKEYTLQTIDPQTLHVTANPLRFSAESYLESAHPSPDGRRLALWFNTYLQPQQRDPETGEITYYEPGLTNFVRILNLQTGAMRDLFHQAWVDDTWGYYSTYRRYPLWSPNGRYLLHDAFIHDFETGQRYTLPAAGDSRTWSADSQQLALVSYRRDAPRNIELEIFDIPSLEPVHHAVVDDAIVTDACGLRWSPDHGSLSFEQQCWFMVSPIDLILSEIYMWSLETNEAYSITQFAQLPENEGTPIPSGIIRYSTVWADAQTLLVSVQTFNMVYVEEEGLKADRATALVQIRAYQVPGGEAKVLRDEWARGWVTDPISGRFAAEIMSIVFPAPLSIITNEIVQDHRVEILRYDGTTLKTEMTAPAGHDLQWSPDGRWLAYVGEETYETFARLPRQLVVLDTHTGQWQTSPLPDAHMTFVGWLLAVPFAEPYFEQGTPTPIPTRDPRTVGVG